MRSFLHSYCFLALGALLLCGCDVSPGRPGKDSEIVAPDEILDFKILYAENCAGCHGAEGHGGAAIALGDPVYLAIADEAQMRKVTAQGVPGTSMPAFAQSSGGMLTDKHIGVITKQIRANWSRSGILNGVEAPSHLNLAKSPGGPARGELVYKTYCESCHGPEGRGGKKGSAITDSTFLALVSDQGLRTLVITGRDDALISWENSRLLAERIPGAALEILDPAGHCFWLERPEDSRAAIVGFLSSKER